MSTSKFNSELAAHNVATILTKACIGEIDSETIPLVASKPNITQLIDYSKQYAYYYKTFYDGALDHFLRVLTDDTDE